MPEPDWQDRRHLPLVCGLVVGCIAYVAGHFWKMPGLRYLPEPMQWSVAEPEGFIAMSFYGLVIQGLAGFVVGLGLGKLVARGWASPPAARQLTGLAMAVLAASLVYFLVVELGHVLRG